jgi:ATP/maltotriose-dependent transcriptional regulator MalT
LTELAGLHAERGDVEAALDAAFEVATDLEVEDGLEAENTLAANVNLGRIALRLNRSRLADEVLQPVVEAYRARPATMYGLYAHLLLASARGRLGDLEHARRLLDDAQRGMDALDVDVPLLREKIAREREQLDEQSPPARLEDAI